MFTVILQHSRRSILGWFQRLGHYTKGDYALEIFQYFGGQHPGGEYLNKPGAEIHNGFLKEY